MIKKLITAMAAAAAIALAPSMVYPPTAHAWRGLLAVAIDLAMSVAGYLVLGALGGS